MKKYWKWILPAACLLVIALSVWFTVDYFSVPKWSQAAKERVKHTYIYTWNHYSPKSVSEGWEERWFEQNPIIWYDEKGNAEGENVWRYIGTYGDCYAFLLIGEDVNRGIPEENLQKPYLLAGLSYDVYYPAEACVILYDAKGNLTTRTSLFGEPARLQPLYQVCEDNWLTAKQLEQLTQDVEKIAEESK